jgi:mono/diheme cytochrome c family protein
MTKTRFVLALLALSRAFAPIGPAAAQEADAGRAIALKTCASCHVVAADQASAPLLKPPAPSFSEIAAQPATTEGSLRSFLRNPHGEPRRSSKMPGFILPDSQVAQVVAYILSLRPKPAPARAD